MHHLVPLLLCPRKPQRELLFVHAALGCETRANRGIGFTEVRLTIRYLDLEARVSSRSENVGGGPAVDMDCG